MDFYFPKSAIFLTTIPKTGCTSAMNFFTNLEIWLEESEKSISELVFKEEIQLSFVEQYWLIHSQDSKSKQYLVDNHFKVDSCISIACYRNPFNRFASFWFDKVVLIQDGSYYAFATEILNVFEDIDMYQIREAAKKFLLENDMNSPNLDPHFLPQYVSFKPDFDYDIYIETDNLNDLPKIVSEFSPNYLYFSRLTFPKFHSIVIPDIKDFYDDELRILVKKFYEKDFKFIREISGATPKVKVSNKHNGILKSREYIAMKRALRSIDYLVMERDNLVMERDNLVMERDNLVMERDNLVMDGLGGAKSKAVEL